MTVDDLAGIPDGPVRLTIEGWKVTRDGGAVVIRAADGSFHYLTGWEPDEASSLLMMATSAEVLPGA